MKAIAWVLFFVSHLAILQGHSQAFDLPLKLQTAEKVNTNLYTYSKPIGVLDGYAFLLESVTYGKEKGVKLLRYDVEHDLVLSECQIRNKKASYKELTGYHAFILNKKLYVVDVKYVKGTYRLSLLLINHSNMLVEKNLGVFLEATAIGRADWTYSNASSSLNGQYASLHFGFFDRMDMEKEDYPEHQYVVVFKDNGVPLWKVDFRTEEDFYIHQSRITDNGTPYLQANERLTRIEATKTYLIKENMPERLNTSTFESKTGNGNFDYFEDFGSKQVMGNISPLRNEETESFDWKIDALQVSLDDGKVESSSFVLPDSICSGRKTIEAKKRKRPMHRKYSYSLRYVSFNDDHSKTVILERISWSDSSLSSSHGSGMFDQKLSVSRRLFERCLVVEFDKNGAVLSLDTIKRSTMVQDHKIQGNLFVVQHRDETHILYNKKEGEVGYVLVDKSGLHNHKSLRGVLFPFQYVRCGNQRLFSGLVSHDGSASRLRYVSLLTIGDSTD